MTGARLNSRYELYSHERVAAAVGLSESKIATITAGQRPADLTKEERIAYDVAACLSNGGQLHDTTYKAATDAFGKNGTAELVYLIGCYSMISILLNAYDVPLPEQVNIRRPPERRLNFIAQFDLAALLPRKKITSSVPRFWAIADHEF